ncbi:hypothetical protein S40285_04345 [Stachybotrys chlorohalonatus IBT 40285]|uniref:N-acetyltransferase domain-containing protein n=1 Tax=Stachybotrys chlorohalonatus (strain IBT 40285) TaxID=1283841 RepID=A0A084QNS1_STAC4|nr:hypothetical protein S40285_04345 [Stachybotrys chlorohalonata IBT 40285]
MADTDEVQWVDIKTMLPAIPYPLSDARPVIKTKRLLLRPVTAADLDDMHALRLQPEVMVWTIQGRPDKDLEETRKVMDRFLPPNDARDFNYAICLGDTGEMVGVGGVRSMEGTLGWPELGYMLRKEAWGKGYASEFVAGFLRAWWSLPRAERAIRVDRDAIVGDDDGPVTHEHLVAITQDGNLGSQNVLRKMGMQPIKKWAVDEDSKPGQKTVLLAFAVKSPVAAA